MSAATAPKCNEIGNLFASQYYRHLVSSPETAHNFYHAEAGFSRLRGSSPSEIVGHEKIKEYIASYNYASCKLKIDTIDSQEKGKNEIIVLVSGIEIDEDKVVRPFCQTFCLEAISGTRYLVRNDVLCYLRNELLNIEQKAEVQPELLESPIEEPAVQHDVELKEEHVVPVHVDMGTQVDLSNLEPTPTKEESLPLTPHVEQPVQVPVSHPRQHKSATRADTKRGVTDPSKPRAWSSVVGGATSGGLPGQSNAPISESVVINSQEPVSAEEEIVTTPAATVTTVTPSERPRVAAPRPEVLNSLYVSNFEPGVDTAEVKDLFEKFGLVKAVKYTPTQNYLFVDFETAESADKALKGGSLKLGDFDLKLERRKVQTFNPRGRGGGRGRGAGRGRGGPPRDSRPEPRTTDRTERREPRESRPREGNDRSGSGRPPSKDERGGRSARGRASRGGAAPTTPAS
jgi:hypothetical protein